MIGLESKQKKVIPLMDKEWYAIIKSIRYMDGKNAKLMLEEVYDKISMLFGIPKKVLITNDYEEKIFVINPEWVSARDWVDYHAGWIIDKSKSNHVAFHHPIRVLEDKFVLNSDLWG